MARLGRAQPFKPKLAKPIVSTGTAYTTELTETVTLTDTLLKTIGRILSDIVTHTDTLLKGPARILTDTVTHTDTFTSLRTAFTTLTEIVTLIERKYNYIVNSSFETNDLYWGTGGDTATKTQDGGGGQFGSNSLLFTGGTADDRVYVTLDDGVAPQVDKPYTFSAYLKGSGQTVRLWVYDGAQDIYSADITLTGSRVRYELPITAKASSGLYAGVRQKTTGAMSCYIDGVQFEEGPVATTYIDGANGGVWTGDAYNSISYQRNPLFTPGKVLSETTTLTDTIIRTVSRILTETITHTDTFIRGVVRTLTETVTHTDTFEGVKVAVTTLTETVTHTDTILKLPGKVLSDVVTHTDTFIKTASRTLTDTTTLTDTIEKLTGRILSDTTTLTDTILKLPGKVFSETTTLTDTIVRVASKVLTETITHTDTIIRAIGRTLSDTVTHTDTLLKTAGKVLSDTITHTDTFLGEKLDNAYTQTLTETLNLVDTIVTVASKVQVFTEVITLIDKLRFSLNGQRWYAKLKTVYKSIRSSVWYTKNNTDWED